MTTTQLRQRLAVLAMASAALTVAACGSDPQQAATTAIATPAASSPMTSAATTPTPSRTADRSAGTPTTPMERSTAKRTTGSATSPAATMLPTSAGDYGDGLISAWTARDTAAMAKYATPGVVATLSSTKAPTALLRTTCEEGVCSWANEAGKRVTMTMNEKSVMSGRVAAVTSVKVAG